MIKNSAPLSFAGEVIGVAQNDSVNIQPDIGKLDLQLTYLWRVHAVDYYAGKEAPDPEGFKLRLTTTRTLRGPRPEEGEQAPEAEGVSPPDLDRLLAPSPPLPSPFTLSL